MQEFCFYNVHRPALYQHFLEGQFLLLQTQQIEQGFQFVTLLGRK